ncbi:MAG: copper homeostasis protein CutC [Ferruginibacter sp.]
MANKILEIIGFTIEGCIAAESAGAHRIELCDNPEEGGTTASYGFIKVARAAVSIDLYPIIRPRGGDFLYNEAEFEAMKVDVQICKQLACDGVVIGILMADGKVDKKRCQQLISLAYPMQVTFHRAFDRTNDLFQSLEDVIELGCDRILTSGGFPNALEGAELLNLLIQKAGHRIIIMPGSGVNAQNIATISALTGATEFHSSARIHIPSAMSFNQPSMKEELFSFGVNVDEIKGMMAALSA